MGWKVKWAETQKKRMVSQSSCFMLCWFYGVYCAIKFRCLSTVLKPWWVVMFFRWPFVCYVFLVKNSLFVWGHFRVFLVGTLNYPKSNEVSSREVHVDDSSNSCWICFVCESSPRSCYHHFSNSKKARWWFQISVHVPSYLLEKISNLTSTFFPDGLAKKSTNQLQIFWFF